MILDATEIIKRRAAAHYPGEWVAGRYRLGAPLGEGGAATVFRALDRANGRTVALKLLARGEPVDGWRARHLRREAAVAAALSHPSLARLLERGSADGRPFLVYEFLPGGSLAEALGRGNRRLPDVIRDLAAVAEGLAHLHERGWVHGDVKPGNVLYDGVGRPRLADFGLAGQAGQACRDDGPVIASPGYASPEQVAGAPLRPASDTYSLCMVLLAGLAGRPLRPAERPGGLPAALLPANTPAALQEVLRTGLSPAPEGRFANGRRLARALEECLGHALPGTRMGMTAAGRWMEAATSPQPVHLAAAA